MNYPNAKVYNDGSHYIAIPEEKQTWKSRKRKYYTKTNEMNRKVENIYNQTNGSKKERVNETIEKIKEEIKDEEKAKELVKANIDRMTRNLIVRKTRMSRKLNLQQWDYFCTFTYDENKINEIEFRQKLMNCLSHLTSRKGWKYIGVWERSPVNNRLHFHGIFYTPQMVGSFIETKDYSTKEHKIQTTLQNTFFLERFGRNDFKSINQFELSRATKYLMKYIQKSGEKIIYSRGLPTYFRSDILESDIVCTIGQEDRKLLLFDDFTCINEGEVIGKVNKDVISQMPKTN